MARQFDMCEVCKLDKSKMCDYKCIKKREDFMFRFFTCPCFIYDDGNTMNNAERISTLLKTDIDAAVTELGKVDYFQLNDWLREKYID